jgi:hypothetical protein
MDEHLHDLIKTFSKKLHTKKHENTRDLISDKFWISKGIEFEKAKFEKKITGIEFKEFVESDEIYIDSLI